MHFSIRQERPDSPFVFQLLSDQDDTLLTSGPFQTRDACTDAIRDTITAMREPESFGIQANNTVALRSAAGETLATSAPMNSRQAATEAIASIVSSASTTSQFDVTFTRRTTRRQQSRSLSSMLQRVSPEELAAMYNFTRTSGGGVGFEVYQEDDQHYFHFNDANGQPLLFGRGFPAASKRDSRLAAVIKNSGTEKRYEVVESDDQYYFILKARNGQEIARSRNFSSKSDAEEAIIYLTGSIPPFASQYIKKRQKKGEALGDVYNFDRESTSGQGGFETFRDPINRQHYFHFNDDDGKALLYSQGYTSPKGRDNGIKSVIRNSAIPERFDAKEQDGKYYFIIRAGNRQEIAQSRFFASAAERDRWITLFTGSVAGFASAYGVNLSSTTTQTESFTLAAPPPPPDEEDDKDTRTFTGAAAAAGALASFGDGGAKEDDPVPAPVTPAPKPEPARVKPAVQKQDEEAYALAGDDDDGGGFRLWLPWIIGLLAVLVILFWLLSMLDGCGGPRTELAGAGADTQEEVVSAGPAEAVAEATTPETMTPAPNADGGGSTGEPPASLGMGAAGFGFPSNSIEGQIADLLSKPDRSLPASFILNEISFPRHSAKLNKSAYDQVDNLIRVMKEYPNIHISFEGHIDGTENDDVARHFMSGENITLSAVRARCLYQKFEESGISENRLSFTGKGSADPLANNNTEQNRQRNRRLEVIITEM